MTTERHTFRGHGFTARDMYQITPGMWCVPMYRNRDGVGLGTYRVKEHDPRSAFRVALKECREDFSRGRT